MSARIPVLQSRDDILLREQISVAASVGEAQRARISSGTTNAMTIDVEDYFQVEAFASVIDRDWWESLPRRVERNTDRVLDLLAEAEVRATFFMLGWVAERHPSLLRRIVAGGHELASHGSEHIRVDRQSPEAFRNDVRRSKRVLEDVGGVIIRGYRAPTFSIGSGTRWAHSILLEEGYQYSSSVYPVKHDLYGTPGAPRTPFSPLPQMLEIPLTTVRLFGFDFPASGGGYFRLLPYSLSRRLLDRVNRVGHMPAIFYMHPWEIDPRQPRQRAAPFRSRFRHYLNLDRAEERLRRLLRDFTWTRMDVLFLSNESGPFPVIRSWTGRAPQSP